jgi:hypothetical protein
MSATTPVNPANHVDEVTGLLYIEGQLEQAAARDVVAHLEHCSACRRLLDTLKRESLLLRQALTEEDEPLPARLAVPRLSEGLSWGWLTALGLAAVGLYTFWTVYVAPWLDGLQQSGFGGQFVFTWLMFNGAFWKGWNDMLQFIIFVSLGVLGAVLLFLLRRNSRRLSSHSLFLGALLLVALAHPPGAQAAEFVKEQGNYEVADGRTVKNDLFVMASSVRIAGTVEGDLFCFCSSLDVEGHVTGDVFAFSHVVRLTGKVDGSLRTFNGNLTIEGDVERNVLSFVGVFQSTPRSQVKGSATMFAGHVHLEGPLGRDFAAFVGEGNINAPVGGNVWIRQAQEEDEGHYGGPGGGRAPIRVDSHADIKGSFRFWGPVRPDISPQAHLTSAPEIEIHESVPRYRRPMSYWYNAMIWGTGFILGLVLIALFPGFMHDASRQAARIGAPLGLGFVVWIMMPVAAVLACITVVGLGVGITLMFLWLFLVFFAQLIAAMWIGEAILGAAGGTWSMAGRLAFGLFLIRLGALLPFLGLWVRILACVLGTGGLALVIYHHMQRRATPPLAAPAVPAVPAG